MRKAPTLWQWVIVLILLPIAAASIIWQAQNPKANKMTFYTHFDDVIHFRKLEKFQ